MYNGRECWFQLVFSVQPIEFNLFLIMHLKKTNLCLFLCGYLRKARRRQENVMNTTVQ